MPRKPLRPIHRPDPVERVYNLTAADRARGWFPHPKTGARVTVNVGMRRFVWYEVGKVKRK